MSDRIEKSIQLKASISKVWTALTDYKKFGEWFLVKLEIPFVVGQNSRGQITYPGYEHVTLEMTVKEMTPEHVFSYTWHPYALEKERDYSTEKPTLVEFRLKENAQGTLLSLKESGFDNIPNDRRIEAFRMNERGWSGQMNNIKKYVERSSSSQHCCK